MQFDGLIFQNSSCNEKEYYVEIWIINTVLFVQLCRWLDIAILDWAHDEHVQLDELFIDWNAECFSLSQQIGK